MKRKVWLLLPAVPVLYLLILGTHVAFTFSHAKSYISSLKGQYSQTELQNKSKNLATDINHVLSDLNIPGVKQIVQAFGFNFYNIRNEISASVQASPLMLGIDTPKKYLIAFQNSAEARGTGGILGAFAEVEINKGNISIIRTGSNSSLYSLKDIPVKVPAEFTKLYGKNPAILQNSNLSPHFPYGAEIWMGLWKKQYGEQLDGVIAIDPSALSYVLKATGPINLKNNSTITSENVVSETLQVAYKKYETNNIARKQYLVDIINATAAKIMSGNYSKFEMAKAIKKGIIENRILLYSRNSQAENLLADVRLGGYLKTSQNNEYRAVIENIDASKLDYYLQKTVTIESKSCKKPNQTQVKVRLTNTLKTGIGLPAYVLTRADKGKPLNLVTGQHRFKLFIYGPTNSILVSVARDNRTNGLGGASTERGRPIYVADVDLAPGQSENLLANFAGGVGKITFVDQPLVRPTLLKIKGGC